MIEILGKREIGFVYLFVEMLLGVLVCINFTMSLSKSLMWHVFIGWCKQRGLHPVLIEFNLFLHSLLSLLSTTKDCHFSSEQNTTQFS